jgi:hypothetical protein
MLQRESDINEIRRELAMLQIAHEALLKSHRKLSLKALGDTPETSALLDEISSDVIENFPEWMK